MKQNGGRQRFVARAVLVFAVLVVGLTLFGVAVDQAVSRFGGVIWFGLLPGVLGLLFGLACAWACIADVLDWRALRSCRVKPEQSAKDGETVAFSGRITCTHSALDSPIFERPCAAFLTRINGQRRSNSGSGYRSQLCGLEFAMTDSFLDTGDQRLRLLALPDVDISFRSIGQGGATGKRALNYLKTLRNDAQQCDEADAEGSLVNARTQLLPPVHEVMLIAETQTTSNHVSVIEDIVPLDETVTVLANFRAVRDELNGERRGGMKIFEGTIDECLKRLRKDWSGYARLAIPLVLIGSALLTVGYWWPG